MATTVRNNSRNSYRGSRVVSDNRSYVYGNAVRKGDLSEVRIRKVNSAAKSNREKLHHMNLGYVCFLVAALVSSAVILGNYIQLQAELTAKTTVVSSLEKQLNNLKLANDEEYNRITSSIDLEEIKSIAIGELGMVYAAEGQIVSYSNVSNDYMRQVAEN